MRLSLYPAKSVWPSGDHASERHIGAEPLIGSARSSSTTFLDSRSQILIIGPAAAQSQYRFGEKVSDSMMSPASRVYRCLPSLRSHSMTLPSLPPEAQSEPS